MEILARSVGRRKEAVAQVQMIRGTGQFIINTKPANDYLQNDSCAILSVQAPFEIYKKVAQTSTASEDTTNNLDNKLSNFNLATVDTIVRVKGGGLKGQAEAIRLGIARALCAVESQYKGNVNENPNADLILSPKELNSTQNTGLRKQLKDQGFLTQDSRVKERRKYGLKKARKASQYHKR